MFRLKYTKLSSGEIRASKEKSHVNYVKQLLMVVCKVEILYLQFF
jgi:hypothetical protein